MADTDDGLRNEQIADIQTIPSLIRGNAEYQIKVTEAAVKLRDAEVKRLRTALFRLDAFLHTMAKSGAHDLALKGAQTDVAEALGEPSVERQGDGED